MKINRKYAGKIRSIMIQNSSDVDSELIESESESAAESFQVLNLQYTVLQFQGGLFFFFLKENYFSCDSAHISFVNTVHVKKLILLEKYCPAQYIWIQDSAKFLNPNLILNRGQKPFESTSLLNLYSSSIYCAKTFSQI